MSRSRSNHGCGQNSALTRDGSQTYAESKDLQKHAYPIGPTEQGTHRSRTLTATVTIDSSQECIFNKTVEFEVISGMLSGEMRIGMLV